MRVFLILFTFLFSKPIFCQETAKTTSLMEKTEKQYFKDTTFEANGLRFEFKKSSSTVKDFKTTMIIKNPGDKYIIIDPYELFCSFNTAKKYRFSNKSSLVIAPRSDEKIHLKFGGRDYREPVVTINISKIQVNDKVAATYDFDTLNISKENYRAIGSVKWTLVQKDYDINMGVRLTGKLIYTGDKFLVIDLPNAKLKTKDGGNYNHIEKTGWHLNTYNHTYYDKTKSHEQQILIFPVKREILRTSQNALLSFTNVLQEYSLLDLEPLKITLRKGTEADYKGQGED